MIRFTRFAMPLAFVAVLSLGACSGNAEVDTNADSTAGDTTVVVVPIDTIVTPDTASVDMSLDTAAMGAATEGIEKLVEAQLMVAPGYSNVQVESSGDGVIILNGTVATEEEKVSAEAEAKKVVGVKSVTNNLTVKK